MTPLELLGWTLGGAVLIVLGGWALIKLTAQLSAVGSVTTQAGLQAVAQRLADIERLHREDVGDLRTNGERENDARRALQSRVERLEAGLADLRLRLDRHLAEG